MIPMHPFMRKMEFEQIKQFICANKFCGKAFKTKKALDDHERIHSGSKPFTCFLETCSKQFTQYSSLQKHERIHRGERPYPCTECGHAFTQVSNLKRHERLHAGVKPHACHICSKPFSTLSNLRQHVQIHDKEQERSKFECPKCKKIYLYQSSLNKHLKSHDRAERNRMNNRNIAEISRSISHSSNKPNYELSDISMFQDGSTPEKKIVLEEESSSTPRLHDIFDHSKHVPEHVSNSTLNQQLNYGYLYLANTDDQQKSRQELELMADLNKHLLNKRGITNNFIPQEQMLQEKQMLEFPEPQDGARAQLPQLELEDYLARTLSPASVRSLDEEEEERGAELERQCDEMIQFDSCNHKPYELDSFDDALTINLHTCSNNQNFTKKSKKAPIQNNSGFHDFGQAINQPNLDTVNGRTAYQFF